MIQKSWLVVMVLALTSMSVRAQQTTFSGRATVVQAQVLGLDPVVLSDTGDLDSTGGSKETSLLETSIPGLLTARVLHASTVGQGEHSRSEASVANLNLTVVGNTIAADFLMARAEAVCRPGGAGVSGSSEIAALIINNQTIAVTGAPNQTVTLPVGKVIINEQVSSANGQKGDITVNALHVMIPGAADVIISSAHADINCRGGCNGNGDFVTGGGWIAPRSGARANFGVAGGIKNGGFWGHLVYIDHGTNMKVKGTSITAYTITGATTRQIKGTAEVNGQGGFTFTVDVADNGEPGRSDTFFLSVSSGYAAGGPLEGGNIQLHKPCK